MGAPAPFTRYTAHTAFLRVPEADWLAVKHGHKTEFRIEGGAVSQFKTNCPTPVVAYAVRGGIHESQLMVLEEMWTEPLGNIAGNEESLRREGYADFAAWRRYYTIRTHRRFRPLTMCAVYRVRAVRQGDVEALGKTIFERLYREHV